MSVEEMKRAMVGLTPNQRSQLAGWFEQHYAQAIDARIETDLTAGRFDSHSRRALSNYEAGNAEPL